MDILNLATPLRVYWDITYACNLNCIHCYSLPPVKEYQELSHEEALALIEDMSRCGVFFVNIAGGEPLLRPDFLELLRAATGHGMRTSFATNGYFVDTKLVRQLKPLNLDHVLVSLDGANAETHNYIRQKSGSFEKAIDAVRLLKSADITTFVCMTLTRPAVHEVVDYFDLARELGVDKVGIFHFINLGRGAMHAQELRLDSLEYAKLINDLERRPFEWKRSISLFTHDFSIAQAMNSGNPHDRNLSVTTRCQAAKSLCYIDPVGDVFSCLALRLRFGNVRESSLRSLWSSAARRENRLTVENKLISTNSCAAIAYAPVALNPAQCDRREAT